MEASAATAQAVTRLYARQARFIDDGDADGWAATFTADGEFHSPSYPEPAVGTAELVGFAERFFRAGQEAGVVNRHVVTNVDVLGGQRSDEVVAHAYFQIVATPRGGDSRLVRLTTVTDSLVRQADTWLISRRDVRRDDA